MASENVSSIKASGGDYTTIAAWEADTDNDLVTADTIEVGELANETFAQASTVTFTGATTNSECYRILRAAMGAEYNPITDTGAKATHTGAGYAFQCSEEGLRIEDIGVSYEVASPTAGKSCFLFSSDATNANLVGASLTNVFMSGTFTSATNIRGVLIAASADYPVTGTGLIAVGTGVTATGLYQGLYSLSTAVTNLRNCVAYNCSFVGVQFLEDSAHYLRNVVSSTSGSADFAFSGGSSNLDMDYCASSDTTAPGSNSVLSITPSTAFRDAANNDFRLAQEDTELTGAGTDLSASFTTDIQGRTWKNWSIGAYEPTDVDVQDNGSFDTGSYRIGNIRYYRIRLSGTTDNFSSPITTTGARIVYAYLGNVVNGSVTAGDIAVLVDPSASGITPAVSWIPITEGAGRVLVGQVDSVTAGDNIVCILRDPPSRIRFGFGEPYDPTGEGGDILGTTPDCYVIVEVHH